MSQDETDRPETIAKRARKPWIKWALLLIGVVALVGIWRWFDAPITGNIIKLSPTPDRTIKLRPITIKGKHVELQIPGYFKLAANSSQDNDLDSDSILYIKTAFAGFEHLAISAQASKLAATNSSSYEIRKKDTAKYAYETLPSNNSTAYIFTNNSSDYERTAFISANNVVVTLSYTSDNTDNENNTKRFNEILASLKIR